MTNIFKGSKPDITPAQIVAAVFGAIGPICVLVGLHLSQAQTGAVDDLKLLALGLFGADAAIRIGRNIAAGKSGEANAPEGAIDAPPPSGVVDPEADVPDEALQAESAVKGL